MTTARTLQPEDVIAHYKVVGPLGVGGMGEVYLAQDQTLERNVALKVLPVEYVQDDERLRRFVLEAKSASSLSHPNIVTIYEIGRDVVKSKGGVAEPDSSPLQYISMELISGRTLSTLIHGERTDLRTLIGYLAQAAEGLAKAHAAGIVHRDLKPGNIMVSADGFAKILDFGLAKLTERRESEPEPEMTSAPTRVEQRTGAGMILGTTAYMSPEQVRGKPVDHRSDIFSFGCVLYEAATRTRPFVADTAVETMHKILHDTPVPIEERNPRAPAELRRLIRRCLAKNPDQRLQSMKDIALELREIADEWDALSSSSATTATAARGPGAAAPKSRMGLVLGAAGLVVVAAVVVAVWAVRRAPSKEPAQPFQTMRMSTQTNRGDVTEAAISRDGRYLAYLTGEVGRTSVRVRQVATGSDLEVVPSEEGLFEGLSFAPDGNYLFYGKRRRDTPNYRALMQVASLGGPSRERAFDVDSRVTFSPDGKSVAFMRGEPQNSRSLIVVRDLESGTERVLATIAQPRQLVAAPAWSPDGRHIAVADYDTSSGIFLGYLALYDAASGARQDLEVLKGGLPESIAWLPDGSGIVRAGFEFGTSVNRQIALVDYPKGGRRRVTNDSSDYYLVSVSTGDESVAAVRRNRVSDLWLVDPSGGEPRPLTTFRSPENSPFQPSICPDGSVVFTASRDQSIQVWSVDASGGAPKPITTGPGLGVKPYCAPQGVLFERYDDDGAAHIWRVDADGSNPRMVTPGAPSEIVDVSRDGRIVTFSHVGVKDLWSLSTADGSSRKVWSRSGVGKISPDGSKILVTDLATGEGGLIHTVIKIVPTAGGAPVPGPELPVSAGAYAWSPDGAGVTFVDQSGPVWNVFRVSLSGGAPQPVTKFKEGRVTGYEFSPDGARLGVALKNGEATNVWVTAADGSKPIQVTKFAADDVFDGHWTPDGKRIVVNVGRVSSDALLIRNFR